MCSACGCHASTCLLITYRCKPRLAAQRRRVQSDIFFNQHLLTYSLREVTCAQCETRCYGAYLEHKTCLFHKHFPYLSNITLNCNQRVTKNCAVSLLCKFYWNCCFTADQGDTSYLFDFRDDTVVQETVEGIIDDVIGI